MSAFDDLLAAGVAELRARLAAEGRDRSEIDGISRKISRLSFPGLLALLGAGDASGSGASAGAGSAPARLGTGLLHDAASRAVQGAADGSPGLPADEVERILRGLLVEGHPIEGLVADERVRDALLRAGVAALAASAGLEVSSDEARQVATLLSTGEFFQDVSDATAAILRVLPSLPLALVQDVSSLQRWLALPRAVARDLGQGPFEAFRTAADLLDGRLDRTPRVMRHTLRALYGLASVATTLQTLRTLISPENRSVRLAVLLYARSNGVDLQQADLDVLRDRVLDPEHPDLGPALVAAVKRLEKGNDTSLLPTLLERLARRDLPGTSP